MSMSSNCKLPNYMQHVIWPTGHDLVLNTILKVECMALSQFQCLLELSEQNCPMLQKRFYFRFLTFVKSLERMQSKNFSMSFSIPNSPSEQFIDVFFSSFFYPFPYSHLQSRSGLMVRSHDYLLTHHSISNFIITPRKAFPVIQAHHTHIFNLQHSTCRLDIVN